MLLLDYCKALYVGPDQRSLSPECCCRTTSHRCQLPSPSCLLKDGLKNSYICFRGVVWSINTWQTCPHAYLNQYTVIHNNTSQYTVIQYNTLYTTIHSSERNEVYCPKSQKFVSDCLTHTVINKHSIRSIHTVIIDINKSSSSQIHGHKE